MTSELIITLATVMRRVNKQIKTRFAYGEPWIAKFYSKMRYNTMLFTVKLIAIVICVSVLKYAQLNYCQFCGIIQCGVCVLVACQQHSKLTPKFSDFSRYNIVDSIVVYFAAITYLFNPCHSPCHLLFDNSTISQTYTENPHYLTRGFPFDDGVTHLWPHWSHTSQKGGPDARRQSETRSRDPPTCSTCGRRRGPVSSGSFARARGPAYASSSDSKPTENRVIYRPPNCAGDS